MADIQFRSDFTTDLVQQVGDDDSVIRAMLISTLKDKYQPSPPFTEWDEAKKMSAAGRIRFLMRNRHGTPFEHNLLTFRSEAPIFVYREWHRHRIGISINEQSGRYVELPPMFYVPPPDRPLLQVGKPGAYEYIAAPPEVYALVVKGITENSRECYQRYKVMLDSLGIAKEVARMVLPVNIYSSMYWTCNARSMMAFLSLRVRAPSKEESDKVWFESGDNGVGWSMFPSKPMWEIDACARAMEAAFALAFPLTHAAFVEFGRVCP